MRRGEGTRRRNKTTQTHNLTVTRGQKHSNVKLLVSTNIDIKAQQTLPSVPATAFTGTHSSSGGIRPKERRGVLTGI